MCGAASSFFLCLCVFIFSHAKHFTLKRSIDGAEILATLAQQEHARTREDQPEEDLNHVSDAELAAAKRRMDVLFLQNQCHPGSPGYIHDIRKDFEPPQEACDWDEDS